jgi:hypothetical protein
VNTTLVAHVSATGTFVRPMLIFNRVRMAPQLRNGSPHGSNVETLRHWPVDRHVFTDREFAPSEALRGPEYPDEEKDVT